VPAVAAAEIDYRLTGLDAGEPQGREDVLAGKLLRSESSRRLEKNPIRRVRQKVPFSR
jgi:hypothetical protein